MGRTLTWKEVTDRDGREASSLRGKPVPQRIRKLWRQLPGLRVGGQSDGAAVNAVRFLRRRSRLDESDLYD